MQLPRPTQISTDPGVNTSAVQWANLLLTQLEKILNGTDPGLAFLKLAGLGDHKLAFGTAVFHWTGATAASDALNVPHGLGVVPSVYFVFVEGLGNPLFAYANTAADATNLKLTAYDPAGAVGAGTNRNAFWIAIA